MIASIIFLFFFVSFIVMLFIKTKAPIYDENEQPLINFPIKNTYGKLGKKRIAQSKPDDPKKTIFSHYNLRKELERVYAEKKAACKVKKHFDPKDNKKGGLWQRIKARQKRNHNNK
jgi:hypothetical protein